jgi:hypothetical protein
MLCVCKVVKQNVIKEVKSQIEILRLFTTLKLIFLNNSMMVAFYDLL